MIYQWDEITCDVHTIAEENSEFRHLVEPLAEAVPEYGIEGPTSDLPWRVQHVIDLPDTTRIVVERSDRNHLSIIITTPED